MRNEKGFTVITAVMAVSAVLLVLIISSLSFLERTARTRGQARKHLIVQEMFHAAAPIVYKAYLIHHNHINTPGATGQCPTGMTAHSVGSTAPNILRMCFPSTVLTDSCIVNEENVNYPYCLVPSTFATTRHNVIAFAPKSFPGESLAGFSWYYSKVRSLALNGFPYEIPGFDLGITKANAQVSKSYLRPTLPTSYLVPASGTAPVTVPNLASDAPPIVCSSDDSATGDKGTYRCVTLQICLTSSSCADADLYKQRIAFPPYLPSEYY